MAHETLFSLDGSRIPPLKVAILTLARPCRPKIELDKSDPTFLSCIFAGDMSNEEKLLRGRVLDGGQCPCADLDTNIERFPVNAPPRDKQ